jgi:hypothetical protein
MENGRRRPAFSGAITRLIPGAAGSPRALDDSPRTPMTSILGRQVPGSGTSGPGVRNVRSRGAERKVSGFGTSGLGGWDIRSRGPERQVSGVGTSGLGVRNVRSRGLGRQVPGSGTSGLGVWDVRCRGAEREVAGSGTSGLAARNVRSRGAERQVSEVGIGRAHLRTGRFTAHTERFTMRTERRARGRRVLAAGVPANVLESCRFGGEDPSLRSVQALPRQPAGRQRSGRALRPTRTLTRRSDRASRPWRPGRYRR